MSWRKIADEANSDRVLIAFQGRPFTSLNDRSVQRGVEAALSGFAWSPGGSGRKFGLLNTDQTQEMLAWFVEREGELNLPDVAPHACEIKLTIPQRLRRIWHTLVGAERFSSVEREQRQQTRGDTWARDFIQAVGAKLASPEACEEVRSAYATTALVRRWMGLARQVMDRFDARDIFNLDEVMLAVGKAHKVVVTSDRRVFVGKKKNLPHCTAISWARMTMSRSTNSRPMSTSGSESWMRPSSRLPLWRLRSVMEAERRRPTARRWRRR
jgi:hypothetical protein